MTDRRRFARASAGLAALVALTGGLVLAGSLAASADDGLEFTSPTDAEMITWTSAGFTFSGSTVTGGDPSVTVYQGDGETQVCIAPVVAGVWSCTSPDPLPIGGQTFIALQGMPAAPPVTDTVSVTVVPGAPTYDQPNPYEVVQDATAFFSGQSSAPDADIQVLVDGLAATCAQDDIAVPGPWSCSIPLAGVAPGDYTMRVRQTAGGYVSEASGPLRVLPAADLELVNPADGQTYVWEAGTFAAIDGRAPIAGSAVDVLVDGSPLPACTDLPVDGAGQWSCGNVALAIGGHTVTVQQTVDEALVSDSATVDVLVPAPEVGGLPLSGEQDTLHAVGGTFGLDGYVVTAELYEGEAELTSCTAVPMSGAWSCDLDLTGLAPSPYYALNVFQRPSPENPAIHSGPPEAYFFEVTAPVMRITSPADGAVIEWTAAGIPISGTTPDPGTPVSVWYDGETFICSDPAPTTTWSCPAGSFVPEAGSYVLTAEQAGQPVATAAIDVTLPAPDVDQSGYSYPAGTAFATFSGGQTYPGADVLVELELGDGVTRDCATTATTAGWSCQIPIDDVAAGTYNVFFSQHTELEDSDAVSLVLEITAVEPLAPILNCAFTPAGFAVSSPHQMSVFGVYPAAPAGGSEGSAAALPGSCGGDPGTTFPSDAIFEFGPAIASCSPTCSTAGLAPGLYNVHYTISDGDTEAVGYSLEPHDYFFTIPEAPAIGSASMSGSTVQLTGTGTPGDTVRVERTAGGPLCTAAVTGSGAWSCAFPASTASSARAVDIDAQSGGMSAYSAARPIPVAVPPLTPVTPAPTPLPTLARAGWTVEITGDLMNLAPGDTFGVTLAGLPLGWSAEVVMHSTPRTLGTAVATGEPVTMELTVPDDIESGAHRLEVIAVTALGTRYYENFDARVTGGVEPVTPDEPEDDPAEEPLGTGGSSGGGGGSADRSDPGAPSALSSSIAPLERIAANPVAIAVAGGLALALLFLVALPTELLNSSLSSNTSRLGRAYGAIDAAMSRAQGWLIRVTRSRALAAGLVVLLVAIVYGFVDPGFGFDVVSVRLVLSLAIAFFLLSFGASWISGLIIHRAWGASGVVAIQPSIILFAIVGVVVARLLDFSPGFLVGVAIGLELIQASRRVSARAVLVQFLVVVGLALAAWVAYSLFTPGDDFAGMLIEDTLVAVTAEGLTGALIAVFPLQFLDGRELWQESRRLWVAAFLLVAVPFALLVLPTAIDGTEVADYGVWLLVFAVFGAVSIAIWLVFTRAAKREEAEAERVDA